RRQGRKRPPPGRAARAELRRDLREDRRRPRQHLPLDPRRRLFDQIKVAGRYRDRLFVIDSREDLMKLQYAGKRIVFSSPEYVSGFQFQSVFVCDVNLNDTETGTRTTWQTRRFSSLLYLAA